MFMKNNKFTLIELIVVIAVLGILSSIVVPNINNMRSKAEITATVSNIRNIQTSVDMYRLEHNGKYPTLEQPVLGKPGVIDFSLLETDYLRDIPEYANFNWWIDYTGTVYGSEAYPVEDLKIEEQQLTWSKQEGDFTYKVYKKQDISRIVASSITSEAELILLGETKENVLSDSRIKKDGFYVFEIIDQNGFASPKLSQEYKLPVSSGGNQDKVNNKPIAVISMTPENDLNNYTNIMWSYENSSDPDGDSIVEAEWKLNGEVQQEMPTVLEVGKHTIELTVQDEHGLWSEPTEKIISVYKKEIVKKQMFAADKKIVWGNIEANEWETIDFSNIEGYTPKSIYTLTNIDNTIIAGLSSNGFLRSEDNGQTWTYIKDNTAHVNNGLANNGSTIIATKWDNYYLKSVNAGKTWQRMANLPSSSPQYDLANNGSNFVLGGSGEIFYSLNNGITWQNVLLNTSFYGIGNHSSNFVAAGQSKSSPYNQQIYLSKNNGQTWSSIYSKALFGQIGDVAIHNDVIIAVTHLGEIVRSTDLGKTWKVEKNNTLNLCNIIYDVNSDMFIATGYKNVIYSTDLGESWNDIPLLIVDGPSITSFISLNK